LPLASPITVQPDISIANDAPKLTAILNAQPLEMSLLMMRVNVERWQRMLHLRYASDADGIAQQRAD
jgi:hypothetical protein